MITLIPVGPADEIFLELLQAYLWGWHPLVPGRIGEDGRLIYPHLAEYEDRDVRRIYLIQADGARPIGFAMIRRDEEGCWHAEEFFVAPEVRRHGLGKAAAHAVFAAHPGRWTLTTRPENPAALAFWRRAIPSADERTELGDDGILRTRLSFSS